MSASLLFGISEHAMLYRGKFIAIAATLLSPAGLAACSRLAMPTRLQCMVLHVLPWPSVSVVGQGLEGVLRFLQSQASQFEHTLLCKRNAWWLG